MQTDGTIINMKGTKQLKEAVRRAAFQAGYINSSQFMLAVLSENQYVKKEMKKVTKKIA